MNLKMIFLICLTLFSLHATSIKTDKDSYGIEEEITIMLSEMMGDAHHIKF